MIIVKITALLFVVTVVFNMLIKAYLRENPQEALKLSLKRNYAPWYTVLGGLLILLTMLGIVGSTVWVLFLR